MLNYSSVESQGWVAPTTKTLSELQMSFSLSFSYHNANYADT